MPAPSTFNSPALSTGQVQLWYTYPAQATDHDLLRCYREILSERESTRHARFVFEKDRHTFLVAHALLRTTLSRYADVRPRAWRFSENDHGKPHISAPADCSQIHFNIAHTDGLVVCAVTWGHEVGVDAENLQRSVSVDELAQRNFSSNEVADLSRLPPDRQPERFFDYWTLKEAYVKARGLGLSIPLNGFWFDLIDRDAAAIHFLPALPEDSTVWQFRRYHLESRHKVALAVRRPAEADLDIIARETVPLIDQM